MKYSKLVTRKMLGGLGLVLSLSLSACGDLSTLLNNPSVQAALQSLQINLNREIDGSTSAVTASDIQKVSANGKALTYNVDANGELTLSNLPADASEIEVQYKDAPEPVIMPIDPAQRQNGRMLMRGVSRFSKDADGKLAFQENVAGFDFNRDGQFDERAPQFVHREGEVSVHDVNKQTIQRFEIKPGESPNFKQTPKEVLQGDKFFIPQPPQRAGAKMGLACGKVVAKADGSLDFAKPNGESRTLIKGEFEITLQGALKIIKAGEPDTGKVIMPPACPRIPVGCQPGQPGQPGMMQPGQPPRPGQTQPQPPVPVAGMRIAQTGEPEQPPSMMPGQPGMMPAGAAMMQHRCGPMMQPGQPPMPQPGTQPPSTPASPPPASPAA
jgi:hypothetical protein